MDNEMQNVALVIPLASATKVHGVLAPVTC